MNLVRLLEHFDRISEAPDAVARLRRFILDLAVRGKLVEQDSNDEPAAELLKRIQSEMARGEKKSKELAPVTVDEAPFDVPVGWEWVRIRQITTDRGQTVPKGDFTYIDVTAIDKERGRIGEPTILSSTDAPSRARKVVKKGDVIYSCVRPYLLNIAIVETEILPPPIASTAFAVMNGFGLTLPQYLWTALRSPFMVESVEERMRGQAYPAINDSDFSLLPIPLPPLAEQHRIVAKVDELMVLCDQLEAAKNEREARRDRLVAASLNRIGTAPAAADEAETAAQNATPLRDAARFHLDHLTRLTTRPEHIKQLRQAILNLAVRGRLVPQDPNDEPASAAVDLVSKEAMKAVQAGVIRRYGLDEPVNDSGLSELPPGWRWSRLVEVTRPMPYAIKRGPFGSAIRKDMFVQKGFKVYEQQHAISGDFNKGRYYITEAKFEELRAFELHPNEILVSCSGTVGKVAIVPASIERGVINQALLKLSLHESALRNEYFLILFPAFFMETETLTDLQGTAQKNIPGMEVLKKMPFPHPPLAEQHRIVAKVDELMALCDQLESQLTATQTGSRRLLEAVLHEALAPALEKTA